MKKIISMFLLATSIALASNNYPLYERKETKVKVVYSNNFNTETMVEELQNKINEFLLSVNKENDYFKLVDIKFETYKHIIVYGMIIYETNTKVEKK